MSPRAAMPSLWPVILAGGSGTRLWPVSRAACPKHLVELLGDGSLLQQTARRLLAAAPAERLIVVGAASQADPITRQLAEVDPNATRHLVLEPSGRNTAAAVAAAALAAVRAGSPDAILWICPSDHLIGAPEALLDAVRTGLPAAAAGDLVTFGIKPSRPETGFGWIAAPKALPGHPGVLRVERFVEKPPLAVAETMLADGGYVWNSGMFLYRADRILEELRRYEPELTAAAEAALGACDPHGTWRPDPASWAAVKSTPIDKAVMERSDRVACVPVDPQWSDVGSWQALWELAPQDGAGNVVRGTAVLHDVADTLVQAGARLVAVAGVRGLVVVDTPDAVLIADRRDGEAVRGIVGKLAERERIEAVAAVTEAASWGRATLVARAQGWNARELVLDAGASVPAPAAYLVLSGRAERVGEDLVNRGADPARIAVIDRV